MDFPINSYPTKAETDPDVLYRSLGSFWTQVFRDKDALKGYTLGLAEEAIQRYYNLVEVIDSYAVDNVPVFHKEKWKPILVYRSKFGDAPFQFEKDSAVFGPQAASDRYYQEVIFEFGFPKRPAAKVYTYDVGKAFADFGVITDRIINPTSFFIKGTDVIVEDGVLFFNRDIFADAKIPKVDVIKENGQKQTYTDRNGNVFDEQLIILWAYHTSIDTNLLFNNFGYIFNLNLKNDQFFKDILGAIFDLYVDGPTVNNIKAICASFLGVTPVVNAEETVESVFTDGKYKFVVTDSNVYRFELIYTILNSIVPGKVVNAGDILVDAIEYYDNVATPGWWKSSSTLKKKLALSQYLFFGDYQSQLVVPNEIDLVSLNTDGDIVFPIEGVAADVARFHAHLNLSKATIKPLLGLTNPGDSVPIQPVDFLMENFLKTNSALMKFKFSSNFVQSQFLALLPILRDQLPPYVYIIFGLELSIPDEVYENLNQSITISFDSGDQLLNADGSNIEAWIENLEPYGYRNHAERMFSISLAIPSLIYETVATETADFEFPEPNIYETSSTVDASATAVTLVDENDSRHGLMITNNSVNILYVRIDGVASLTEYSFVIWPGMTYTMPSGAFLDMISGIWDGTDGEAAITEISISESNTFLQMKDGAPLKEPTTGATTASFGKLQLLDFT